MTIKVYEPASGSDIQSIEEYLYAAPTVFWNGIKAMMNHRPTISGYVTTYDAIRQAYPFEQCIASMLQFCDEVCVVDGGSSDGTWEWLMKTATLDSRLKVKQVIRDWKSKRHPVFDGMQKAEARSMCTKDFCWQMDADEVVHEDDAAKIVELCRVMPKNADIIALPVIEFWGSLKKIRMDINPWKWRLSRNNSDITHGIPAPLRLKDADGEYAAQGTDGCDMVSKETGQSLPFISFYTTEADQARRAALTGNAQAKTEYERWFNAGIENLPSVFHYSWVDIPRKIRLYRNYWQNHWRQLYNQDSSDTADNNMFFNVPWSEVTDEMIELRASELKETGGHIWHSKWNGQIIPHVNINRSQPKVMT